MPSLFTQPRYTLTFVIVMLIWAVPDVLDAIRRRPQGNTIIVRERRSHWFIRIGLFLAVFVATLLAFRQPGGTLPYHRPYLFIAGVVIVLAGFALRRAAIYTLGRYFTLDVATYTDQRVIDDPPYRRIRHPAYSGSMLCLLGTGLMLGHWLGLLLIALAIAVTFSYRVRLEERALLDALGQPYAEYMGRTKRFVPFFW